MVEAGRKSPSRKISRRKVTGLRISEDIVLAAKHLAIDRGLTLREWAERAFKDALIKDKRSW